MHNRPKPITLVILDGWGYSEKHAHNAIAQAHTPTWDHLLNHYPYTLISGSGKNVGLPSGQMGNSEVGHLNIGAGRIIRQELSRIDDSIASNAFFENETFLSAINKAKEQQSAIHVCGLLSAGGVHSHEKQIFSLLSLLDQQEVENFYMHAFLDGRDTAPQCAQGSIEKLQQLFKTFNHGQIASVCGRYYAMDRDQRWQRTQSAYDLITQGNAEFHAEDALTALQDAYQRGETDEFIQPITIHKNNSQPTRINDGDVVIFMNFRADRARQLCYALTDPNFQGFKRDYTPKLADFVTLTKYANNLAADIAFPAEYYENVLGDYLSQHQLKQLRLAETEKYAHVTYFFNGGIEQAFPGEERVMIPSPKVATYDLQPEMHAAQLTDKLVNAIQDQNYDFIVCNFANPDMVGHTGNFQAAMSAVETIDQCLARIIEASQSIGGDVCITADHGNVERMYNENNGQPHTAHTNEPVPFVYVGREAKFICDDGALSDIAPTLLTLFELPKPKEMTGKTLLELI